ncbi:hypothetical protein N9X24_03710, partial [Rickettsiales bacterium]|nr:hypothetical protein [Rickettsiales bacterium]
MNQLNKILFITYLLFSYNISADSVPNRPDYHAPIGVMRDHIHKKGEIMTSYRLGYMYMDENRNNRDRLTIDEIDYIIKPTSMTMKMHMFGAMYGLTNHLTLGLMGGFAEKKMTQINNNNEPSSMDNNGQFDTKFNILYQIYNDGKNYLQFNAGLSVPTGSIKDTKDNGDFLSYPMQMGSGTYDLLPGISYSGFNNNWSWGGQFNGTFRLGRNNSGYTLGDIYNLTAWAARKINNSFSISLRLDGNLINDISGKDRNINPMTMGMMAGQYMAAPMNPELHDKKQIDALIGVNFLVPNGYFIGHRLALELGMPAY